MDELTTALDLATEEELKQLTQILFSRRFNPIDYLQTPAPIEVLSQSRQSWLDSLEERFRYLAADGFTVLKRKTKEVSYRQILIKVCHYLKVPYSAEMSTTEIEGEIFLYLLNKAWKSLPTQEKQCLQGRVEKALAKSNLPEPLPLELQHDPVNLLLKGSSAWAFSSIIKPWLLKHLASQFAVHFATYQAAKSAIVKGGSLAATKFQNHLLLQAAKRGMVVNAARYGAVRGVLAAAGPILWGYFFADLGWRAIATNYTRIIPAIFALAQIRLIRGDELWEFA